MPTRARPCCSTVLLDDLMAHAHERSAHLVGGHDLASAHGRPPRPQRSRWPVPRTTHRAQRGKSSQERPVSGSSWGADLTGGLADRGQQLIDRLLRADGVDGQAGAQLEPGDVAQPRVDLPVPVVGLAHALVQRRGVQHQVVGRAVEHVQQADDLLQRLGRARSAARRWPGRSRPRGGAARPTARRVSAKRRARSRRWRHPRTRVGHAGRPHPRPAGTRGSCPRG